MVVFVVLLGCGDHAHNGHDHDEAEHVSEDAGHGHGDGTTAVTLWTDRTELFMEYPDLVVGEDATFIIHFSKMDDFKPVTEGPLTSAFRSPGKPEVSVRANAPSRPGIYLPTVRIDQPGEYVLELYLDSPQVADVIRVPGIVVHANASDVHTSEEEESDETAISFLKEQQWKIDYRTEPAARRRLSASIAAVGEILPKIQAHAEVPSLVNGVMMPDQNNSIPSVGTAVTKGQVLAVVSPSPQADEGLNRVRKDYLLAESEFHRAQRLYKSGAIPEKRLEAARLTYEAEKAGYSAIEGQVDFDPGQAGGTGTSIPHFHVKSPIDGVVEEIHFHAGEAVEAGQKLFTVTNPERVWLRAQVPLAHVSALGRAVDASFHVEGYDREFVVSDLNGKLISIGSIADRVSRTVSAIFELNNPDRLLKIHMFADVSVKTEDVSDALAIPVSAVYDDDGIPVAYVQVEGETFERRSLRTGIADLGYVEVLEGIAEGERVVTEGGYQVRLASLSTGVPTGHGHAH